MEQCCWHRVRVQIQTKMCLEPSDVRGFHTLNMGPMHITRFRTCLCTDLCRLFVSFAFFLFHNTLLRLSFGLSGSLKSVYSFFFPFNQILKCELWFMDLSILTPRVIPSCWPFILKIWVLLPLSSSDQICLWRPWWKFREITQNGFLKYTWRVSWPFDFRIMISQFYISMEDE